MSKEEKIKAGQTRFMRWYEEESGWGGEFLSEGYLAAAAWNAALSAAMDDLYSAGIPEHVIPIIEDLFFQEESQDE